MKIEYILSSVEKKEFYTNYSVDEDVSKEIKVIPNTKKYLLTFSRKSNDEISAKILSKIHDEVFDDNELIPLSNGSSEYYLFKLYPMVIQLELKLRKLLRIVNSKNETKDFEKVKEYISKLESETLSKVFEFFFTDEDFNKRVKSLLKDNKELTAYNFSKKRYIEIIQQIKEETPWEKLLGERVPSLKDNYINIYEIRNEIAHAHLISFSNFKSYSELIKKAISELDETIEYYITSDDIKFTYISKVLLNSFEEFYKSYSIDEINLIFKNMQEFNTRLIDNYQMFKIDNPLIPLGKILMEFADRIESIGLKPYYDGQTVKEILSKTENDDTVPEKDVLPDNNTNEEGSND